MESARRRFARVDRRLLDPERVMTATLAARLLGSAPTVEQVVEGDAWAVQLDLAPVAADLLTQILRALYKTGHVWQLRQLGYRGPGDPCAAKILDAILAEPLVQEALRLDLHPDAAEGLWEQVERALVEPETCRYAGCDRPAQRDGLCQPHLAALDLAEEGN